MPVDANDLLMGSGVKSAAFPDQQYGSVVTGPIVRAPEVRQQTDFDSGKPKFFDNGDPMMQIVVHLQTTQRDPETANDDGVRALYLKAQMQQAVRDAVKAVGAKGLEVGGVLTITYIRDEPNSRGRGKPKKVYAATYAAPTAVTANEALMAGPEQPAWPQVAQPGAPAAYVQPVPAAPIAPASVLPPAPIPAAPPGVDPAMWLRMAPEQQSAVLAAMGQTPPF